MANVTDILGDATILTSGNEPLTRLWRTSLNKLRVSVAIWDTLLTAYIDKCAGAFPDSEDEVEKQKYFNKAVNLKSNLSKFLAKDIISWKNFCRGVSVFKMDTSFKVTLVFDDKEIVAEAKIPPVYDNVETGAVNLTEDDSRFILANLYHQFFKADDKLYKDFPKLCAEYCNYCAEVNHEDLKSLKSNLPRALATSKMTWSTFWRGTQILKPNKVKLELKLHHPVYGNDIIIDLVIAKPKVATPTKSLLNKDSVIPLTTKIKLKEDVVIETADFTEILKDIKPAEFTIPFDEETPASAFSAITK